MIASRRNEGFVLVSVVWLTLIMLIFAGLFNSYANSSLDAALTSKSRIAERLDQYATEQTLLYVIAIGSSDRNGAAVIDSEAGEQYIRLDGSEYEGIGQTRFRVNDYSGLIGLNSEDNLHLSGLLERYESNGLVRQQLMNSLYDYIDEDGAPRTNGREAPAYRVAGLPLPRNAYLRSPHELMKVYGWQQWLQSKPEINLDWLTTNWRSRINLNAVPPALIPIVLDLTPEEAEFLVNRRLQEPFINVADLEETLNYRLNFDEDFFSLLPSYKVKIQIYAASSRKISTIAVLFSPMSVRTPWEIDYRYQRERNFDTGKSAGRVADTYFHRELSAAQR